MAGMAETTETTPPKQLFFDFRAHPAFGRADFLTAPCNQRAFDMICAWPQWTNRVMMLCGDIGSGKTHLTQVWRERSGAIPLHHHLNDWREQSQKNFYVDDIDRGETIRNNPIDEETLFEILNHILYGRGDEPYFLLLTAREESWWHAIQLKDLRSRLALVPKIRLDSPNDQLMSALLVKLFQDRQISVTPHLIDWLLTRMERSFGSALDMVARLDKASQNSGRKITLSLAREVLSL